MGAQSANKKNGQTKRHKPPISQKQAVQLTGKHRSWFHYHRDAFSLVPNFDSADKRTRLYYVDEIEALLGTILDFPPFQHKS